ncbi:MAG TPA: amino acid ABC transporter permease [Methanocorpusculum sp.]|jgi:polar amino acid transport system permease protein|nr:amino acid ABC transporter permease [Methanocorpusculum sp.]HJJ62428.1 amino acid ABC transporter permease [Methanocorpusculum sp.]HJJ67805.1 amino acid ABC transporter permease [Methanocorpusculum sp.]HJJ77281.1 amino acid ABC transporter permease [Methanocorpusculum sp.]HJJ91974.1 amino acid ABC transporter permease [Methanocorpusculum sp.]
MDIVQYIIDQIPFWTDILLPALIDGLWVTLQLVALTAPFGFLLGFLIAVCRVYGPKPLQALAKLYVIFFRGCPLLVLLFLLYFGLPSIGIVLGSYLSALFGFILCNSAYNSEYLRGGLQSIKGGQMLAARSLGMTKIQAILHVVIPQAFRRALPGVSNEFIYLIKYSSLAYVVTVIEMTGAAKIIATKYFAYFEAFAAVGIFYLILVSIATIALSKLEKKLAIPGVSGSKQE